MRFSLSFSRAAGELARAGGRRADTGMPLKESEAIILRSFPLGEADRLVSFLSRTAGRIRGVARGARRPRSRFGSTLEPLSYIRIWFYERETRELVRISQCELIESFLEAQRDYTSSLALALASEITEAVLPDHEPADAAFRLLLLTSRVIQQKGSIALAVAHFALWTVRLGGWLGSLERCARCNAALGTGAAFGSGVHAGLACANCRRPGMRLISGQALEIGRRMLAEKLEVMLEQSLSEADAGELSAYLLDIIEHQIERKLTTRELMEAQH